MKPESPLWVRRDPRTRDRDVPSDHNCSPRARYHRALETRQMQRPSTSVWLFRLRQLVIECFSSNHPWCGGTLLPLVQHVCAFIGFCFAKIALDRSHYFAFTIRADELDQAVLG